MYWTYYFYFYVSDTLIGIPKEEQQEIFSSFKKLDREVPGTGLGLTLSQTIIQNLGGRAGLESEVNKGSTFWFVVPLIMDPYNWMRENNIKRILFQHKKTSNRIRFFISYFRIRSWMMICNLLHNLFFGELYRHLFAIVNLTKADLLFCEIFF